jgi:hypothetical protein
MPRTELKICSNCILPDTFPGISFNEKGICNHCRQEEAHLSKASEKKALYRQKLNDLISAVKGRAPAYDVIIAYSGGKDSSYSLKLLKDKYGLRTLAMTFDNHFVSPVSWENMRAVTGTFDADHIIFRPPWPLMKTLFCLTSVEDVFPAPTLLRASSVCTCCIGMVKSLVLKTALEMSIPLVAFGWSPGQAPIQSAIMKTNPALTLQNQKAFKSAFPDDISLQMASYLIPDPYYELYKDRFPHNVHPLAFFEYDEERIKTELESVGWKSPKDTDSNSTNCLLNAFANYCHLNRHHFHPYVWEIANMVRRGDMSRDEGIEKIYSTQNQQMVDYARNKLGLQ